MSITEELERLQSLRERGALTDDEYVLAKSRLLNEPPPQPLLRPAGTGPLARSSTDRVLGGVCGGLGRYTGVPSWLWRVTFCLAVLVFGVGIIPYVLLWIFMPADEDLAP